MEHRKNGRHFADDFVKCIFVTEKYLYVDLNLTTDVCSREYCLADARPSLEPKMTRFIDTYVTTP